MSTAFLSVGVLKKDQYSGQQWQHYLMVTNLYPGYFEPFWYHSPFCRGEVHVNIVLLSTHKAHRNQHVMSDWIKVVKWKCGGVGQFCSILTEILLFWPQVASYELFGITYMVCLVLASLGVDSQSIPNLSHLTDACTRERMHERTHARRIFL